MPYANNKCLDYSAHSYLQSDQGLRFPLPDSVGSVEYIDGQGRPWLQAVTKFKRFTPSE